MHLITAYEGLGGPVETLVVSETGAGQGNCRLLAGREAVCLPDSLLRSLGLVDSPSGILAWRLIPAPAGGPGPRTRQRPARRPPGSGQRRHVDSYAAAAGFR